MKVYCNKKFVKSYWAFRLMHMVDQLEKESYGGLEYRVGCSDG